ncbi:MAG TPA: cupredoxin domain-containing protein [Solirubrobacteraceae bacterium]
MAAVALAVSISACGSLAPPSTRAPAKITVASRAGITFSNRDQTPHTATGTPNGFDTGRIKPGQSKTISVSKPGTYTYYCQFHAFMHGTIIVR